MGVEDDIKQQQLEKLRAETRKLEAERHEIEGGAWRLIKRNWLRVFVWAILTIPLTWFYLQEVILPTLKRDNIKLSLENEEVRDKLRSISDSLNLELQELDFDRLELESEKLRIDSLYNKLSNEYEALSSEYSLSERDRRLYKQKADSLAVLARPSEVRPMLDACPCFDTLSLNTAFRFGSQFLSRSYSERSELGRRLDVYNRDEAQFSWTAYVQERENSLECSYNINGLNMRRTRERLSQSQAANCARIINAWSDARNLECKTASGKPDICETAFLEN